jgi:hypothetical protein
VRDVVGLPTQQCRRQADPMLLLLLLLLQRHHIMPAAMSSPLY